MVINQWYPEALRETSHIVLRRYKQTKVLGFYLRGGNKVNRLFTNKFDENVITTKAVGSY